jgi:hypothetical protein
MLYDLFDMLSNVICQYFVEDFHACSLKKLVCNSLYLVVSLSGLGISVILDEWDDLGSFPSISIS